jgi:GxxExxY protein
MNQNLIQTIRVTEVLRENEIGALVVDAAIAVHRKLGPGLLESVYEAVLAHELRKRGLTVERQVPVEVRYDDLVFEEGFRADIIVNDLVILELKSVEQISRAHQKQLTTYLKLAGKKLGYLLNFSGATMKEGIQRIVNGLGEGAREDAKNAKNENS